ncbi:ribonuclease domain-containing protein [Streptomyces sp. SAJ15]|uniref:ribonuclease domain-containing protein n=1 Tax=Streptomyces sp. SAJ15 TaxID=2011095 RepID=UPI00118689A8|nr:ribonuclease domain-containing protein [Streptomyces sp. SAJ15]TVL92913.1 ribonuclease [Streptomyces sp. SAJ15]
MNTPPRTSLITRIGATGALATALLFGGTAVAVTPDAHQAGPGVTAAAAPRAAAAVGEVCYSDLPSQAHTTLDLIDDGGPFPYPQDGTVFQNREGVLPKQTSGYYHEYTVKTPDSPTRGARRIVTGKGTDEDYYTADHYSSFDLVDHGC